jgi:hypothetical protein
MMRNLAGFWRGFVVAALGFCGAGLASAAPVDPAAIKTFDRAAWPAKITACDRLSAHPDDPDRIAPGVEQKAINLDRAIKACAAALKTDPDNPRLNYQMARVHGYAGKHAEGEIYREKAVAAGYPQSLFVVGFIEVTGWSGNPKNVCHGAELVRRSALAGRLAGQVGFPHWVLGGAFAGCSVRQDKAEMQAMLTAAKPQARDFYERLLIENLELRLVAWSPG